MGLKFSNVIAMVAAFNQEKTLLWAFSVIIKVYTSRKFV